MTPTVGIDIGGTFTDVLVHDEGSPVFHRKIPSAADPAESLQAAFAVLHTQNLRPSALLYSTTLATNALLQHSLPRVGLLITAGFRHILALNQPQQERDDGSPSPLASRPVVPLEDIHEVTERLDAQGNVQIPISAQEVRTIVAWGHTQNLKTLAVSLLHSVRNPEPERRLRALLLAEDPSLHVRLSSDVLPEQREYERTVATCLNAALQSLLETHLNRVRHSMEESGLHRPPLIMQSSGGLHSGARVSQRPLTTVSSGPSAAAVAMARVGAASGFPDLVTFDMGGTSTDIALVQAGQPVLTTHGQVSGYPLRTPMVDITSIGAGGGSIVQVDPDTRWRVGPLSAGADPGPVCYDKGGTQVTVTDANLLLHRLPASLLDGALPLSQEAAEKALFVFGQSRRKSATETAQDIVQLVNHTMCGAIRRVCTRRGLDPREAVLMAGGGAGPLHAADLAALLGIPTVVIPAQPGFAAPFGLFCADIREDGAAPAPPDASALDPQRLTHHFTQLEHQAQATLSQQHLPDAARQFRWSVDFHYVDMSTQLTIDLPQGGLTSDILQQAIAWFHHKHEQLCGFSFQGRKEVSLSTLRITAIATQPKPGLPTIAEQTGPIQPIDTRSVFFFESRGFQTCPVYARTHLGAGATLIGPAVIEQYDATTLIPPDGQVTVDRFGTLTLRRTPVR